MQSCDGLVYGIEFKGTVLDTSLLKSEHPNQPRSGSQTHRQQALKLKIQPTLSFPVKPCILRSGLVTGLGQSTDFKW